MRPDTYMVSGLFCFCEDAMLVERKANAMQAVGLIYKSIGKTPGWR